MISNRKLDRSITRDGFRLWKLNNYLEINVVGIQLKNAVISLKKTIEKEK